MRMATMWKVQFHARWASQAVKGYTEEVFGELARLWKISESEKLSREAPEEHEVQRLASAADLDSLREQLENLKTCESAW